MQAVKAVLRPQDWEDTPAGQSGKRRELPAEVHPPTGFRGIGILLPNDQRQHRTLYIQKDVLPYALC